MKNKNNGEPDILYQIRIDVKKDGTSNLHVDKPDILLHSLRSVLTQHTHLVSDQIAIANYKMMENQVKIIKPNQLPPKMKLQ